VDSVAPSRGDFDISLATTGVVTVGTGATDSSVSLRGGEIIFSAANPLCVPAPGAPCAYMLKKVEIMVGAFSLSLSNEERASIDGLSLFLDGPISSEDTGVGVMLPTGTPFHACMRVDGTGQHSVSPLPSPLFIGIDTMSEVLSLDGVVDLEVRLPASDCAARKLTAHFMLSGSTPWKARADGG
jgi:hypothetical protein